MTAEQDIAAIDNGGANTAAEVRTALTAVLGRADYGMIERVTLASAGVITFSNIPTGNQLLFVLGRARGADVGATEQLRCRVGSGGLDTGSNYSYFARWDGSAGSNQSFPQSAPASSWSLGIIPAAGNTEAGAFGPFELRLMEPEETGRNRPVLFQAVNPGQTFREAHGGGDWMNTIDAVDTLGLFGGSTANLVAGSWAELWGHR